MDQPLFQRIILHCDFQRMTQDFEKARRGYINIGALIQADMSNHVITFDPNVNTLEKWNIPPEDRKPPRQIRYCYVPVTLSYEYLAGMMADDVDGARVLSRLDEARERVALEINLLKTRMENQRKAIEKRNAK